MSRRPTPTRRAVGIPAAVALGSAFLLPGAVPADATPPEETAAATQVQAPVPVIDWSSCGEGLAAFECASVEVPTDYDDPTGVTTTIALTRLPARDPGSRIGTLFTNPGGPGASGVDFIQNQGQTVFAEEVYDHFDVLGFDPRTVGGSDPATCYASPEEETAALTERPAFPVGAAEERSFLSQNIRLASDCRRQSRDRFAHASTANVARDMDMLRQAVGDEELTYSGYSYGTALGATYSMLFPDRVRALSLDGTVLPQNYTGEIGEEETSIGSRLRNAAGADKAFTEFLRLCTEAGPEACSLAGVGDPTEVVEQTMDWLRTRTEPVTVIGPDGTQLQLTYSAAVATIIFPWLGNPQRYPDLADLLTQLATADPDAPWSGATTATPERADPDRAQPERVQPERVQPERAVPERARRGVDYPSVGSDLAPLCADSGTTGRPFDYADIAAEQEAQYPYFGALRAWVGLPCEFLRAPDADAYTGPWEQQVDEPVLVIGTRFDPTTPYDVTQAYADLYPDATVLTVEGWGHTIASDRSTCADRVVADYLIDLDTPSPDNATCQHDRSPFDPIQER